MSDKTGILSCSKIVSAWEAKASRADFEQVIKADIRRELMDRLTTSLEDGRDYAVKWLGLLSRTGLDALEETMTYESAYLVTLRNPEAATVGEHVALGELSFAETPIGETYEWHGRRFRFQRSRNAFDDRNPIMCWQRVA